MNLIKNVCPWKGRLSATHGENTNISLLPTLEYLNFLLFKTILPIELFFKRTLCHWNDYILSPPLTPITLKAIILHSIFVTLAPIRISA